MADGEVDLERTVLEESTAATPVLFLLVPGVTPSAGVQALATAKGQRLACVPMGQGQEVRGGVPRANRLESCSDTAEGWTLRSSSERE